MNKLYSILTTLPLILRMLLYAGIAMITSMAIANLYVINIVSQLDYSQIKAVRTEIDRAVNTETVDSDTQDDTDDIEDENNEVKGTSVYKPIEEDINDIPAPNEPDPGIPLPDPDTTIKP